MSSWGSPPASNKAPPHQSGAPAQHPGQPAASCKENASRLSRPPGPIDANRPELRSLPRSRQSRSRSPRWITEFTSTATECPRGNVALTLIATRIDVRHRWQQYALGSTPARPIAKRSGDGLPPSAPSLSLAAHRASAAATNRHFAARSRRRLQGSRRDGRVHRGTYAGAQRCRCADAAVPVGFWAKPGVPVLIARAV